jgi:hypothetical protein
VVTGGSVADRTSRIRRSRWADPPPARARAQTDDGHAEIVHQILLAPERLLTRAAHTRVEAHLSLVFGNGDVGAKNVADACDKGVAHGSSPG